MSINTSLVILIIVFTIGIFVGGYLNYPVLIFSVGIIICTILFCINFYFAHKIGKIDTEMRLFDMEKHWEILEKNPHLVKEFRAGFKQ